MITFRCECVLCVGVQNVSGLGGSRGLVAEFVSIINCVSVYEYIHPFTYVRTCVQYVDGFYVCVHTHAIHLSIPCTLYLS